MQLLSNGICPLCDKKTNITNKSGTKYENNYICMECSGKLLKHNINLFNIKKHNISELKDIINAPDTPKNVLECPFCHEHNIELLSNDKNYKTKYKTTINLNPLKIFTLTNTKEIKKETSKSHNEYFCKDCGNRWIGK